MLNIKMSLPSLALASSCMIGISLAVSSIKLQAQPIPDDRLAAVITSWRDPLPGQNNRSSDNFSVQIPPGYGLSWLVEEGDVVNYDISFNIVRDVSGGRDPILISDLASGMCTSTDISGRSIYIANPQGASDYFQVRAFIAPCDADSTDSSSFDLASTRTGIHSFESYNYPGFYIRHQNSLGEITQVSSELDRQDATFRLVPGLAGECKSFESINYPGHYLRHQNYRIKLSALEDSDLFRQDATFCVRNGLANSEAYSFESYNYPDHYIRHKQYHLYIEQDSGDLFNADATYSIGYGLGD